MKSEIKIFEIKDKKTSKKRYLFYPSINCLSPYNSGKDTSNYNVIKQQKEKEGKKIENKNENITDKNIEKLGKYNFNYNNNSSDINKEDIMENKFSKKYFNYDINQQLNKINNVDDIDLNKNIIKENNNKQSQSLEKNNNILNKNKKEIDILNNIDNENKSNEKNIINKDNKNINKPEIKNNQIKFEERIDVVNEKIPEKEIDNNKLYSIPKKEIGRAHV